MAKTTGWHGCPSEKGNRPTSSSSSSAGTVVLKCVPKGCSKNQGMSVHTYDRLYETLNQNIYIYDDMLVKLICALPGETFRFTDTKKTRVQQNHVGV